MFWVNQIVEEIRKKPQKSYLVTDYKTPSGKVHVGSLRGVLIHDAIYRGLRQAGETAEYLYGFDDFDPMDGLPVYLDEKKYRPLMGLPLCNIPSPEPGYKSYADYYAQDFLKVIKQLGCEPKFILDSDAYRGGEYNESIRIALDHAAEIRAIYQSVSGSVKADDWYPLNVICPKCGKMGTTKVTGWDGQLVSFTCEPKMVDWAVGCGYQGQISPFDGNAKLPYKLAIVARWQFRGTAVELAGLDHYTKGGAFFVARAIAEQVFKIPVPYSHIYEWIMIDGGKKMSSSKGVGVSAADIVDLLPAQLVRFLMMRTRAKTRIEFKLDGDAVPRLYDELDRCIDEYLKDPQSDLGQAYEYAQLLPEKPPVYRLRFSKIAYLLQMPRASVLTYAETEKGDGLTADEKAEIAVREDYARKWLATSAPDSFKFNILDTLPPVDLSAKQKEALAELLKVFSASPKLSGEELHSALHQIKADLQIEPKDLFSAIYSIFLGKDSGPQAGWLLASLDRDLVVKRLNEAVDR
ncbi:MAG: lysine--tRNA ligase [Patescibacteria group bacterium]|jgi:lysyl-tRNA synthetase class 1